MIPSVMDNQTPSRVAPAARDTRAHLIVNLTHLALAAPDVPSAVTPILEALVSRTAAVGSAYFQAGGGLFRARAASGDMPQGPAMDAILAHGLPSDTPLMRALAVAPAPLFFDDTHSAPETAGFPQLGVKSLAAAPVRDRNGVLLGAFLMHTFMRHHWQGREADLFGAVAGVLASLASRLVAEEAALAAREGAIRSLGLAVEHRDNETHGHTDRVTTLAVALGEAFGLKGAALEALRWGAYLHDIGKVAIPDAILHKPGRLDEAEWALMRQHPELGDRFATELGFLPAETLQVVLHHHERFDGAGYPNGLAGEAVPLSARIFSVCDVYDALTSTRPYKRAWTHEEAMAEITHQAGKQFDPQVVAAFARLHAHRGSK